MEDTKEHNLVRFRTFNSCFATSNAVKKSKASEKQIRASVQFLVDCIGKVRSKSLLKYKICRGASCLDPAEAKNEAVAKLRLTAALKVCVDSSWITGLEAEKVGRSYMLLRDSVSVEKLTGWIIFG